MSMEQTNYLLEKLVNAIQSENLDETQNFSIVELLSLSEGTLHGIFQVLDSINKNTVTIAENIKQLEYENRSMCDQLERIADSMVYGNK